jgi:hypothetical protein
MLEAKGPESTVKFNTMTILGERKEEHQFRFSAKRDFEVAEKIISSCESVATSLLKGIR